MIKKSVVLLMVLIGIILFCPPVLAGEYNYSYLQTVKLTIGQSTSLVNGAVYTMDQPTFIRNGRTLVPLRFLGEALGARVDWDSKAATAVLQLKNSEVKVTIGSNKAYINGRQTDLDVPAELKGGRVFVPLRFVSEAFGARVDYEAGTKKITISLVDTDQWKTVASEIVGEGILCPPDWTVEEAAYFKMTSPLGSQALINLTQDDLSEVIAEKSSSYINAGFTKEIELPLDPTNPDKGKNLVFLLEDAKNPDNSDIAGFSVSNTAKGTLVLEYFCRYSDKAKDMIILYQIFGEIKY